MGGGEGDGLKQAAASGVRYMGLSSAATIVIGVINTAVLGQFAGSNLGVPARHVRVLLAGHGLLSASR